MGMCLALHSVSDENIQKILSFPPLIWRLIAADDPDIYLDTLKEESGSGFFTKLFGKKPAETEMPELSFSEGESIEDDLDKSWQGIHYCLNQTQYEARSPMDFITLGGEAVGNVEVGCGPARLFKRSVVKEIYGLIGDISREDLKSKYNPSEMDRLDIYPNFWERDGDEGFEYIAENFERLKTFLSHCVKNNLGMAVCIC